MIAVTSCQNKYESSTASAIEKYADSLFQVSIDSAQIAGGAIIVFQKNKSLLKKSYGMASLELSVPMPDGGQFEIGSVTKQFTYDVILLYHLRKYNLRPYRSRAYR